MKSFTDNALFELSKSFKSSYPFLFIKTFWGKYEGASNKSVVKILKDTSTNILLIVDEGKEIEAITRLSRVGFDNCLGYLDGGFLSWKNSGNKIETITNISPLDFTSIKDEVFTLDVRKKSETSLSSLESSIKIPLSILESKIDHLDTNDNIYIHCAGGYRSMIAASILKRNGFNQIVDINKGFSGIQKCLINSWNI